MSSPDAHPFHDRERVISFAVERARRYLAKVNDLPVAPRSTEVQSIEQLCGTLPGEPEDPSTVVSMLDEFGSPATVASAGSRFFGFVQGGTLPAALGASWVVSAWDQNAALYVMSPVAAELEQAALRWTCELLGLPAECGGAIVTGATMANFSALAAARHFVLTRTGWDVEAQGLFGAPPINVVVGEEVHVSLLKALSLLGLGRDRVTRVPVDKQGRMRTDALPALNEKTILCLQAGNVNTGAFDPANEIIPLAHKAGAWVHVDGAFGLWAAASPKHRHLVTGYSQADSWATDAHKWPNVGYDCGIAIVREHSNLRAAMVVSAADLASSDHREPSHYTPDASRRARGVELWAALRSLGRSGMAELVDRTCKHARRFAAGLSSAGYEVLNDVVINQVLVSFGAPEITTSVVRRLQEEGTCWCGSTVWQGRTAMRISVSSWATTDEDVERSLAAMLQIAADCKKVSQYI